MSDIQVALAALIAIGGAVWARSVPFAFAVVVAILGSWSLWRRCMPPLFGSLCICVACGLGTSSLSNAANQGLLRDVTSDSGSFQVSLLTDPAASPFGGQSASARIGDMHVQVQSAAMQELHAGQTVRMSGELKSMPIAKRLERRQNHQVAVLKVVSIERVQGEATWFRFANSVRSIIERGARSLPPNLRALFNGIVLGDDRNQTLATGSLFRRSGLSHITAVSGQNVAFVMAVFRPLLHRLRLSQRWLATAVIIVLFATMVRFEPSVLRATAMVAVSVTATTFGRPLSPLRALSLVAIGLIFLDPLLVYSLGFQLSVTACLGIALLTKPIARVLVGPSWLCEALAVTIAAQVGTAPFLFKFSGGVPVVSLVANVVALPLASFVMMWGLAGGLLAGLSPVWMAALIHIPTRVALEIVNAIATVGARLSLGRFGVPHIAALAMMAVVVAIVGSPRRRINTRGDHLRFQLLRIVCATILLLPTLKICAWGQPDIHDSSLDGMRVDRNSSRTIVVVYKTLTPNRAVRTLERLGVYRVDELVVTKNSSSFATVAVEVRNCFGPTHVVAPRGQFLNFDWVTYV